MGQCRLRTDTGSLVLLPWQWGALGSGPACRALTHGVWRQEATPGPGTALQTSSCFCWSFGALSYPMRGLTTLRLSCYENPGLCEDTLENKTPFREWKAEKGRWAPRCAKCRGHLEGNAQPWVPLLALCRSETNYPVELLQNSWPTISWAKSNCCFKTKSHFWIV